MAEQKAKVVPSVSLAALNAVQDPHIREVLRTLVDAHQVRNGQAGNGNERFVTAQEVGLVKGHSGMAAKINSQGAANPGNNGSNGSNGVLTFANIALIVNDLQAKVLASPLFADLGSHIALIDSHVASETQNRIDALLQEAQTRAAAIIAEESARASALADTAQRLSDALALEAQNRISAINQEASRAVAALLDETNNRSAAIASEHSAWTMQTGALAQSLQTVSASTQGNTAAIQTETKARSDAVSAEASSRNLLAVRVGKAESDITLSNSVSATQASTLVTMNSKLDGAQSNITTLQQTSSSQASTLSALSSKQGSSESAITQLQSSSASQASSLSTMTAQVSGAQSAISTLQQTSASQASTLATISSKVGSSEASISALQNTMAGQATTLTSLSGRTGLAESAITLLNTAASDHASSIASLKTRADGAESSITGLQTTSSGQAQTISTLSSKVATHEASISSINQTSATQASSISALEVRSGSSEGKIATLNSASSSQAASLSALSVRTDNAESGISSEGSARLAQDNAIVQAVQTIWAAIGGNAGLIQGGGAVVVNTVGAIASTWAQVQAAIKDGNGNIITSSSIKQSTDALVSRSGQVEAKWVVNVDAGGNAIGFRQAGFGISGSSSANGPQFAFGVRADQFWIAAPNDAGQSSAPTNKVPFIVKTSTWIDGRGYQQAAGVYLNDLFATTAKIGNAQITSAMIGDAQVNTLKIGANAVTVPFTATFPGDTAGQGVGVALNVASGTIVLDGPAMVFASSTGLIAYGGGWVSANSNLTIDGTQVSFGGGDEAWVNAAHSGGKYVDIGPFPRPVTVVLNFFAQPGARIISPTIFIMGAKR